ncbi:hypothetical protein HUT18_19225 [Streptomyces sp. NA04227]|nr:hypothetical protein HUT18_19225 [Streptomyces sp. NA04227]
MVQLVVVLPGSGLGWDETVYISQLGTGAEPAYFSAPRSRGITFLIAPVTALTSSVPALRAYLAVLSGAALFCALMVWRRLLPPAVVTLAGALFAGLWVTVFYGPQAMPNLWVALGAMCAVGCFLHAAGPDAWDRFAGGSGNASASDHGNPRTSGTHSPTAPLLGLAAAMAFIALMRPSDALWLGLPLLLAALCVRRWRRPALFAALVVGTAAGGAQWVVEAYTSYGGLGARLHRASEIQGHLGPHLAFDDQVRTLNGRTLCRPCGGPWRHPVTALWWFALPVLVAVGALAAVRDRFPARILLPTLTGLSLAVPYLLLIGYAAPRFLLPAYALLSLPAALGLTWLATAPRPGSRPLVAAVLALLLVGHLAVQYAVLSGAAKRLRESRTAFGAAAATLHRQGVRAPCVVSGPEAVRLAHRTGCTARQTTGHDRSLTEARLAALARRRPVAVVVRAGSRVPAFARDWRVRPLPPLPGLSELRVYVSPLAWAPHVKG